MMKNSWKHINLEIQYDSRPIGQAGAHFDRQTERSRSLLLMILTFLLILSLNSSAQKIDAFARVSVSPREGVVRQPYKVTISVYSSTWFAEPLQFTNLRIDNAFILPFTRTVSGINYMNNKKYATLTFYYLVFPYNTGQLQIPELVINASIPPEGDYKGQPVTIKTKPQTIRIKPVPSSEDQQVWMVAKNVRVKENWSRSLNNLKVGDVIEREITITANGTLPSLIQPFEIEKPENASIYPKEPELQDKRNDNDVNGVRVENYSYLFEEEGEITIPEEVVLWWNPETRQVYKRTIPEQKISIAPNPDLAIMESLKDSLQALTTPFVTEEDKKTIPWVLIGFFAIIFFFLVYFGSKIIGRLLYIRKEKRSTYLQSEAFYFKKLKRSLNTVDSKEFIKNLYVWFDAVRQPGQDAAIYYFLDSEERNFIDSLVQNSGTKLTKTQVKKLDTMLQKLRTRILYSQTEKTRGWQLNPV